MEDPWLNAWRDDQNHSPPQPWSSSNNVTDDQVDIAVPSWAPESPILWSSDKSPGADILPSPTDREPALIQENAYTVNDVDAVCDQELSKESSDADGPATQDVLEMHAPDPWTLPQVEGGDWVNTDGVARNENSESLDEWELAKQQKELQDRYVPPELLATILSLFDEFSADYWPQEPSEGITYDYKYDDLADVLGVSSIIDRLVPADLTLPPTLNFMKSFISKEMIDALKLTRHHSVTLYSPLAMYMNSKGSLSWEASVKSKSYVPEADVAPSGWRIVSQENSGPQLSTTDKKKKAPGGLLSFFSRKTLSTTSSKSPSPTQATTPVVISPRTSTTSRASSDADIGTPAISKTPSTNATRSTTMSALAEISATPNIDASIISSEAEVSVQASSAVSRFFGRFSRSDRSSASNSLALSTDDLEFLSDIVPSFHDGTDDIDQLNALSSAIHAPSISEKLPPSLVPPPRAPPPPARLTSAPSDEFRPSNQTSACSHPDSVKGIRESPISPGFSQQQSRCLPQTTPLSLHVIPPMQASGSSGLQLPLSPSSAPWSSANKLYRVSAPTKSYLSLPVDDGFSDFQMSPNNTSAPLMSSISSNFDFGSFSNSAEPIESLQTHDQSISFDDFDDFVSSPPKVPEKPSPVPLPRLIPPPPRPSSSIRSVSPTRRIKSPTEPRQAVSDQRTSNLLETREVWAAPPPPNLIPPTTRNDLFDTFDGPSGFSPGNLSGPHIVSSLSSLSESNPSLTLLAAPPLPEIVTSKSTTSTITSGNGLMLNGMTSLSRSMPPSKSPSPPLTRSQNQHDQKMQFQLKWSNSVSTKPSSSAQPTSSLNSFVIGQGGSLNLNGSSSGTLFQQHPQQRKSEPDAFSSLFSPAIAPAPSHLHSENQNSSSNNGKLSAQDLSFFEGL